MNISINQIVRSKHFKVIYHIAFWIFTWVFYVYTYIRYEEMNIYTFLVSLSNLIVAMATIYTLNYYVIPKFLLKQKYLKFIVYLIITLLLSFYFQLLLTFWFFIRLITTMLPMFPGMLDVVYLFLNMYFIVLLGISIKLFKRWNFKEKQEQELQKEKVEAELKMLKTQINPHFLFNTLNSIYVLAMKNSTNTADTVLKLSDILDFILYKNDAEWVLLSDELNIVKNYVELEKIRFGDRATIDLNESIKNKDYMIPPMIIIPLVENAFKHGVAKSMEKSWIKINVDENTTALTIEISNSRKIVDPEKESKGIGLVNVKRRLEILYKENFEFIKTENTYTFTVKLIIKNTTND